MRRDRSFIHHWRAGALVGALVLSLCGTAFAQTPATPMPVPVPVLPPLGAKPEPRERPRWQVRFGPLQFTPGFSLRDFGVDTNVFNSREDRKEDFTLTAGPEGEAKLEIGRFRITGTGDVAYVYYHKFDDQRSFNRSIAALAEARVARRLLLFASDSFRNTRERLNLEVDARARRIEKGIRAGALIAVSNRVTTEIAGSMNETRFADDASIAGISLAETLNQDTQSVTAKVAYVLTPLTTMFVTGEGTKARFTLSPDRDFDQSSFTIGASFKPRALLAGLARIGYQRSLMINRSNLDYSGLLAALALRYRMREATELGVNVRRSRDGSFQRDSPFAVVTNVGISLRQHLFRSVDVTLEGTREDRSYARSDLDDQFVPSQADSDAVYIYSATFGINTLRSSRVHLNVQYANRSSQGTLGREYDGLRVGATFSIGRFMVGNRQAGGS